MLPVKIRFIIDKYTLLPETHAYVFDTFVVLDPHSRHHLSSAKRSYYLYLMKACNLVPVACGIITRTPYQAEGINLCWRLFCSTTRNVNPLILHAHCTVNPQVLARLYVKPYKHFPHAGFAILYFSFRTLNGILCVSFEI